MVEFAQLYRIVAGFPAHSQLIARQIVAPLQVIPTGMRAVCVR